MAQVWQALNSLSKTVGDRGGIADAMLRGADASLGLKKAEYDIARGQAADKRAAETFDMTKQEHEAKMPGVELQAQKDKSRMEMVRINANEIVPQDLEGITHFFKKAEDGESLDSITTKGLPGVGYDDNGDRVNKDGSIVMIPRWQKEERYLPSIMAANMARIDPIKKIEDGIFKGEQALTGLGQNTPEYVEQKKKVDTLRAVLADPKQLATFYAQKTSKLQEIHAWGIANNLRQDFLNMTKSEADKAQTNYEKYSKTMTKEEKALFDLDIQKKKADIELAQKHGKYYEGAANKANRPITDKALSFTEQLKRGENAVKRFSAKHGISEDNLNARSFTEAEKNALETEAAANGLEVYFDEGMTPDKDRESDYIPFNSKDVKAFKVRAVIPMDDSGAEQEDTPAPKKGGKAPAIDFTKAAAEINLKNPDMSLKDIGANLKSGGLGVDENKAILVEIARVRAQKNLKKTATASSVPVEKDKGIFHRKVDLKNPLSKRLAAHDEARAFAAAKKRQEELEKYNEKTYGNQIISPIGK